MGIYTLVLPIATAMVLHGIAQSFSNGFRTWFFREHINWKLLPPYLLGSAVAACIALFILYIPEKHIVFLFLGTIAMLSVVAKRLAFLAIEKPFISVVCGFLVTGSQIISGVSGPLLDAFYLRTTMNRYEVIATKSLTQTCGHMIKLLYYAIVLKQSIIHDFELPYMIIPAIIAATFLGSRSGKFLLQYVSERNFTRITQYLILAIGVGYLYQGINMLEPNWITTALADIKAASQTVIR